MRVRVFRPIEEPDQILETIQNPPTKNSDLANFIIADLDEITVGSGDLFTVTLPDDEIGEILRREPGAIPVRLDLTDDAQVILDTLVTFVIVEDTTLSARIDLAFVADARSPLSHGVDTIEIDPAATVDRVAAAVSDAPAPALVSFTPETLTALADTSTERGLSAIDDIRRLLDGHLVPPHRGCRSTRRPGDSPAKPNVLGLFAQGQETTESFLGRTPVPIVHMDPDTTAETSACSVRSASPAESSNPTNSTDSRLSGLTGARSRYSTPTASRCPSSNRPCVRVRTRRRRPRTHRPAPLH